jgi:hypothetical protein
VAVYVDNARILWRGSRWCHLVADSLEELHRFAQDLGLKRAWFQGNASLPHYDVTTYTRELALRRGAVRADRRTLISRGHQLRAELAASLVRADAQLSLFE